MIEGIGIDIGEEDHVVIGIGGGDHVVGVVRTSLSCIRFTKVE